MRTKPALHKGQVFNRTDLQKKCPECVSFCLQNPVRAEPFRARTEDVSTLTNLPRFMHAYTSTAATNRLTELFARRHEGILSVYFTAGYPKLADTVPVMQALQQGGADLIEIGIPFSDPIADGPTIQESNMQALENGMRLSVLFEQLQDIRRHIHIPLVMMGYLNPIMQYGIERFCQHCQQVGIDGLILPDLPMYEYQTIYRPLFEQYGLKNTFLITPQTSEARIREIDAHTDGFIYMVSSASTTGAKAGVSQEQVAYFERIRQMNLRNPRLIGFGISDQQSFRTACQYAHGAIIGSALIRALTAGESPAQAALRFVESVKA